MTRLVTLSPSVPASGLSLTEKVIESVGGSIGCACSGSTSSSAHSVSATLNFGRPAMATISPASATSIGVRSMPRNARIFDTRPCSTRLPLRSSTFAGALDRIEPENTRPVTMRPRYGLASSKVPSMRKPPAPTFGDSTWRSTMSNSGPMSFFGPSRLSDIQPCLAEP